MGTPVRTSHARSGPSQVRIRSTIRRNCVRMCQIRVRPFAGDRPEAPTTPVAMGVVRVGARGIEPLTSAV